jgi:hypothetical protein
MRSTMLFVAGLMVGLAVQVAVAQRGTKAILANITDPYMGRIELVEITPESSHKKAIDAWK